MKKNPKRLAFPILFVLSLCFSQLPARAEEKQTHSEEQTASYYETNELGQLHYRVPSQHFLFLFGFDPDLHYSSSSSRNGQVTNNSTRSYFPTTLTLTYGFTDTFSIGVSEGYLFHSISTSTNATTGNVTNSASGGFSDPTLSANYRYLGALTGTSLANAYLNFTPSTGHRISASTTQPGNDLSGRSQVTFGSDYYWVKERHELSGGIAGILSFTGHSDTQNFNNNTTTDTYFYADFSGRYRLHLSELFYLNFAGTMYLPYSIHYNYYNVVTGETRDDSIPFRITPQFGVGLHPSPNTLLTVSYIYNGYGDNYSLTRPTGTTPYSNTFAESALNVVVNFQF